MAVINVNINLECIWDPCAFMILKYIIKRDLLLKTILMPFGIAGINMLNRNVEWLWLPYI